MFDQYFRTQVIILAIVPVGLGVMFFYGLSIFSASVAFAVLTFAMVIFWKDRITAIFLVTSLLFGIAGFFLPEAFRVSFWVSIVGIVQAILRKKYILDLKKECTEPQRNALKEVYREPCFDPDFEKETEEAPSDEDKS